MASGIDAQSGESSEFVEKCLRDLKSVCKLGQGKLSNNERQKIIKWMGERVNKIDVTRSEFVGMKDVKVSVVKSGLDSNKPADRILLFGPSGSGKTKFAKVLAKDLHTIAFTVSSCAIHAWEQNPILFTTLLSEIVQDSICSINQNHMRVASILENFESFYYCYDHLKVADLLNSIQKCWTSTTSSLSKLIIIGCSRAPWNLKKVLVDSFNKKVYLRPLKFDEQKQLIKQKAGELVPPLGLNLKEWDEVTRKAACFSKGALFKCVEIAFGLPFSRIYQRNPHSPNLKSMTKVDFDVTIRALMPQSRDGWDLLERAYQEFDMKCIQAEKMTKTRIMIS